MANNENLVSWKPGQSGNLKGRPRKSFRTINDDLRKKGIEPLKKQNLIDAYALIFNSTKEILKGILGDSKTPYALKLIIMELNDKNKRTAALKDYRDYSFGKAQGALDVTTKGEKINAIFSTDILKKETDKK